MNTIKRIKEFFQSVSWPVALHSLTFLLVCIGGISLVSFIGTAHWLLAIAATVAFALAWFVLYQFELGWRTRRTFGRQS